MAPKSCPQCNSEKTEYRGLFDGWKCQWCDREWIDHSADKIDEQVAEGDEFDVAGFENPLSVTRVSGWKIYLDGQQTGEYYLKIRSDGGASFYRKRGVSERNEFGSRWKRVKKTVKYEYSNPGESPD